MKGWLIKACRRVCQYKRVVSGYSLNESLADVIYCETWIKERICRDPWRTSIINRYYETLRCESSEWLGSTIESDLGMGFAIMWSLHGALSLLGLALIARLWRYLVYFFYCLFFYHRFVDTQLWKTEHLLKHFQNFHESYVLLTDRIKIHQSQPLAWPSDLLYVMLAGCDWWISIRFVDNM